MQALPVSASSIASQAVTVFDGDRGQKLASWCQFDDLAVPGQFAEEVRAPTDDIVAEQVADVGDDPRLIDDIVHHARLQMGRYDGVVVVPPRHDLVDHAVELVPYGADFRVRVDAERFQVTLLIEGIDLISREHGRMFVASGVIL